MYGEHQGSIKAVDDALAVWLLLEELNRLAATCT